jgi:hypothetical protein
MGRSAHDSRFTAGAGGGRIMPSYKAPVDDVMFLLSDVFHIDRYNNLPGFAEATRNSAKTC